VIIWIIAVILYWDVTNYIFFGKNDWAFMKGIAVIVFGVIVALPFTLIASQKGVLVWPDRVAKIKMFTVWDTLQLIIQIIASIVDVFLRFILAVVFLILALLRADRSPLPGWTDKLLQLDKASKTCAAVVKLAHTHSHPVMLCFVDVLQDEIAHPDRPQSEQIEFVVDDDDDDCSKDDADCESKYGKGAGNGAESKAERRESKAKEKEERKEAKAREKEEKKLAKARAEEEAEDPTPRNPTPEDIHRRIRNRFWLAVLLTNNPSLIPYRKHHLAELEAALDEENEAAGIKVKRDKKGKKKQKSNQEGIFYQVGGKQPKSQDQLEDESHKASFDSDDSDEEDGKKKKGGCFGKKKKPEADSNYDGSDCQDEAHDVSAGNKAPKAGVFKRKQAKREHDEGTI